MKHAIVFLVLLSALVAFGCITGQATNSTGAVPTATSTTGSTNTIIKTTTTEAIANAPGNFIEFWGNGCPHCERMIPVVAQVENETGISFEVLEVWYNESNKNLMNSYSQSIQGSCGMIGVPAFYSVKTGKALCGETSAEKLKAFIEENR